MNKAAGTCNKGLTYTELKSQEAQMSKNAATKNMLKNNESENNQHRDNGS